MDVLDIIKERSSLKPIGIQDLEQVNELVLSSKASWGYDSDFMLAAASDLLISEEDLNSQSLKLFSLEIDQELRGVVGFRSNNDVVEMEYFFVRRDSISKGFGRQLWEQSIEYLNSICVDFILICSDPNALGFYQHLGAVKIGEIPSPVSSNRFLPVLIYLVNPNANREEILKKLRKN